MSLSDSFPEHFKEEFTQRNLKIGSVIRVYVSNTNPPKIKRFILVGQSYDQLIFATKIINSAINPNVFHTEELRNLNLELLAEERPYLEHNSFADCSHIYKRDVNWLLDVVRNDPQNMLGEVSKADLEHIRNKIKSARTIAPSVKKTFGIFL